MPMESVAVVAVPFPAQGHLNALLHLSLQLAARGVPVHYAAPAEHVRQARSRVHGWGDDTLGRVHFHELPISTYASPPPDPAAESAFPSHLVPMWEAFAADAPAPLAALLSEVSASCRRVAVLYDFVNGFAAEEAARLPNGEGFGLVCTALSCIVGPTDAGSRLLRERGLDFKPVYSFVSEEFLAYAAKRTMRWEQSIRCSVGILANTCHALEGEFIHVFAQQLATAGKKLFAVGPLNPLLLLDATKSKERHECLDWLDKQPPASVLYVSFGSTSSLRGEQVEELAAALRDSEQRFIWVLRDADRANIFADHGETHRRRAKSLPELAGHTQGRGMVITGWAPQLEILAHPATAAFLSHCGWNSIMESMAHGKPVLAWPMHSDQPWDAELLCNKKHLKAGILVRPMEKQREVIPAAAIQEAIDKVMVSDEGRKIQKRAMVLGQAIRASSAAAGGGSQSKDLDKFIAHISR